MTILNKIVISTLILSAALLIAPLPAHASTCIHSEKYYTLPQIFTLSSYVFTGTATTIKNDTGHKWDVNFSVEKVWKGDSVLDLTLTTNDLQGCGYSITGGGKYLIYAISSPPFLQISWSKAYSDAQSDILLLNDPNFQKNMITKDNLNVKLEAAKAIIANIMSNGTSDIPFNLVAVDTINSTLRIGIDKIHATMSKEQYEEKIKNIIGDVPIQIEFGEIVTDTGNENIGSIQNPSLLSVAFPLQQLKLGIEAKNVVCNGGFQLIIKAEDGSPACVKPNTSKILVERGWAKLV